MEFTEVVRRRRMVRNFDPDRPVPTDSLARVLEHATRAPSAGFTQGWDFIVLTSPQERQRFWEATTDPAASADSWLQGVRRAPCLIVCCSHKDAYLQRYAEADKGWTDQDESRWPAPYWDIDTGMAALLMLLTGVDEGLGTLFFGVPPQSHTALREALAIPSDRRFVGVVALGYPWPGRKSPSLRRGRRTGEQVTHWGAWGQPHSPL